MSLFRYLKGHIPVVLLIFVLLAAQVVCDLLVPRFTSDIVDVGIQQGGVADAVPEAMAAITLDELCAFVPDAEDAALVRGAYAPSAEDPSVLELGEAWSHGEARRRLDAVLEGPAAMVGEIRRQGAEAEARLAVHAGAIAEGDAGASSIASDGDGLGEAGGGAAPSDLAEQRAASFVLGEYERIGYDTEALQMSYLLSTGAKMLGLALLSMAFAVAVGALASRTAAFVARDLRERVFSNVLTFSRADMQSFGPASLITRCTNDIQLVQMTTVMLLRVVAGAPIMGVAASVMVALTAPGLAWIVAVAVVAILCVVVVLMRATLPRFRIMQGLVDRVNLVSREALTGVAVVRAFGRERREEERFDVANRDLTDTLLFTNRAMAAMMPAMMLLMNLTGVAITWFGAFDAVRGSVQVGDLIAFISYAMQVCMAFMMITMVAVMLPRAQVAADRIDEVVSARAAVADPSAARTQAAPEGGWRGLVRYEGASLRFEGAEADVLHDVSFEARPGSTTAIIGSTGSGKSTLVRLLPRFYDVTAGRITVDGVDVRDIPQDELRSLIGYVPQKAVLFSGTIRSNIAYADPAMPDERVRAAADAACATEFILEKPEGFDAPVSQGGTNVSGGQRQRISIARAVAAEPRIFIFDDSFSALDFATDAAVRANLRKAAGDAALIVVAQRVATVLDADSIVVLDEGRVAGCGTHLELMEGCPAYREIAESQLSEAELAGIAQAKRGGGAR